jgi:hypothetical protein
MEIFIVSFLVIMASCGALALGPLLGRDPVHGGCRPGSSQGKCANTKACSLRCSIRRLQTVKREP